MLKRMHLASSARPRSLHALVLLLFALCAVAMAHAAETIERFDTRIEVQRNGDLVVTETLAVRVEGIQIRHGIYRDFPTRFEDARGRMRQVGFKLESATRDGQPEPWFMRRNDAGLRIVLGSEDALVAPGIHTWQLRYRTTRQIRFLPDHVELYWNVTGNEWAFPISHASATVRLPGDAAARRWGGYTGAPGARGEDWRAGLRADNALRIETTRPLAPGEGLTLVAQLPRELVAAPGRLQRLAYALHDYRRPLIAGLGFFGVLAFYLLAWNAVGRDPPAGPVIALFHPPENISPELAAYIHQWGWSGGWREFTAAAVALAVKGLLVFEGTADKPVLVRRGSAQAGASASARAELPPGERALLAWVDARGGRAQISREHGETLVTARKAFQDAIERNARHRFFRRNLGHFAAGLGLSVLAVGATLYFGGLDEREGALLGAVFVVCLVSGSALARIVRLVLTGYGVRVIVLAAMLITAAGWFAMTVLTVNPFGTHALSPQFGRSVRDLVVDNGFPFALVGGFALLNGLFYYLLRAPTAAGRVVMDRIAGLRLYLRTAESGRLNLARAPELNAEHFERLLPYAIALQVERPWSEAFEAAFARSHPGEDLRSSYRPAWRGDAQWGERRLGSMIAGMVTATQASFASAVPPPRSSASGFSTTGGTGGGGGGGGGGGW